MTTRSAINREKSNLVPHLTYRVPIGLLEYDATFRVVTVTEPLLNMMARILPGEAIGALKRHHTSFYRNATYAARMVDEAAAQSGFDSIRLTAERHNTMSPGSAVGVMSDYWGDVVWSKGRERCDLAQAHQALARPLADQEEDRPAFQFVVNSQRSEDWSLWLAPEIDLGRSEPLVSAILEAAGPPPAGFDWATPHAGARRSPP